MMATIPHVTSGLGLRKFQADGFLLTRVYLRLFITGLYYTKESENRLVTVRELRHPTHTLKQGQIPY